MIDEYGLQDEESHSQKGMDQVYRAVFGQWESRVWNVRVQSMTNVFEVGCYSCQHGATEYEVNVRDAPTGDVRVQPGLRYVHFVYILSLVY